MRVLFPALVSPENAKKKLLENFILFKLNLFYHYDYYRLYFASCMIRAQDHESVLALVKTCINFFIVM